METVEVVIKIPQEVLNTIWAYVQSEIDNKNIISDTAYKAIANGTVLPKGHGRLIDVDALENEFEMLEKVTNEESSAEKAEHKKLSECINIIKTAHTIIEADKDGDTDG